MTLRDFVHRLCDEDFDKEVVFYRMKDYNLTECEVFSIDDTDDRIEIIITGENDE